MKKHFLPMLVSLGLVLTLCSCGSNPQQPGGISKGAAISNQKNSSKSFSYPPQTESCQPPPEKVAQAQFVLQSQAFSLKNSAPQYTYEFTFQLKNTSVSKKLTGFPKADIDYFDYLKVTADTSGNLTSAHSYVYLDFMVKNMLAKEAKICLDGLEIVSVSADSAVDEPLTSQLQVFDKPQHDKSSKDYYIYKFQAHEETTFRMVYIVPDKGLKTNLCFEINPTGIYGNHGPTEDYEAKRFIKLNLS